MPSAQPLSVPFSVPLSVPSFVTSVRPVTPAAAISSILFQQAGVYRHQHPSENHLPQSTVQSRFRTVPIPIYIESVKTNKMIWQNQYFHFWLAPNSPASFPKANSPLTCLG